jgi:signal transduction histidine kinase
MNAPTIVETGTTDRSARVAWHERWFHGLGNIGFAIVAMVALLNAVRRTIRYVVMEPFETWIVIFLLYWLDFLIIGVAMLLAVVWARNRVPDRGAAQYAKVFIAMAMAAAAAVVALHAWATDGTFGLEGAEITLGAVLRELALLGPAWVNSSVLGLLISSAWLYLRAEADHVAALQQCAVDSARMDQQTAEARLLMLEAQIEPHFLFNTLAHVKRLYETDPASGERMLGNLKDYLAVALPQMREKRSTLAREVDHTLAYLNIQQVRMGRRLAFAVDIPPSLRDARMPPLMLLTLVENAIKHGLAPLPEGGRIDLRASSEGGRLRVQVADNGQGFAKSTGGGTGLANIRARLTAIFGHAGTLALALNAPRGVIATIVLPHEDAGATRGSA